MQDIISTNCRRLNSTATPKRPRGAAWRLGVFLGILAGQVPWCPGQNAFVQHNLVSDIPGLAANTDTNLVNPWGLAFSANSPFWISDNHSGYSTLYNSAGTPQSLIVAIPSPAGGTTRGAPTGMVFNNTTNFVIVSNTVARFIFPTEDGTIVAWANASGALIQVDNSSSNAIYKGLALGKSGGNDYLYAADFHNGKIDVFDGNYRPVTLGGSFVDTNIPPGYAPFNVQNIDGQLFVAYAKQDADREDDVAGPGNGYVDVFDTAGNLVWQFATNGVLNSPWGIVKAPEGFGIFGGMLLVGNFGDGKINVFDPATAEWIATVNDASGTNAFQVDGLWALAFGNGGNGGDIHTLYFTAGIAGPGSVEDHGLFGSLAPVFPVVTTGASYIQRSLVSDLPGLADHTDTNLVNPWGISFSATSPFWIADNHGGVSTLYNSSGTPSSLIVNIPAPGGNGPGAPTGTIFNNTTDFTVVSNTPARFIFATEDGTIVSWASGTNGLIKVDNSSKNAIYKGLAIGSHAGSNYLYAADFHNGKVDAFDGNYVSATLPGGFLDPTIPAGYAPFNIQNINGSLFVTYALQDDNKEDDVPGRGSGFVNVFDTGGQLVRRFASGGMLNSPWGVALAPKGFGSLSGSLLVGNFGDGRINAFDPVTGIWIGRVEDQTGNPFSVPGLWAIAFGNGGNGGDLHTLYFTAGIPGSGGLEDHGLFGSLTAVTPDFTGAIDKGIAVQLDWAGGMPPFLLQKKAGLSETNWMSVLTTSNRSAIVPKDSSSGIYRVVAQSSNTVFAFSILLSGASEVPPVLDTSATGIGTLSLQGSNLSYSISFSGLSGPATGGHIHAPASTASNAPVIIPFTVPSATSGSFSGTVAVTPEQVASLVGGLAYVNIHSGAHPGGEIRSQVVPLHIAVALNGAAEVPPVSTTATGTGTLTLIGNQLLYTIDYAGLAGPGSGAHIHGPADAAGPAGVLVPLATPSGKSGRISGSVSLDPTTLGYLLSGLTYINIHSTTNAGGEIRGQIWPIQLGASLNGASEVGPTTSAGSGVGQFTILNGNLSYSVVFTNLAAAASAGHIHGPADTAHNAPVIIPFSTVPAATSGTISGTAALTPLQLFYLITGQTYANIHNASNPGGEIRGQLIPNN